MDAKAVAKLAERLRPFQEALENAWQADLSEFENGETLMEAMARYNEMADAVLPDLARAANAETADLRTWFEPKHECEAMFRGVGADYLQMMADQGTLFPRNPDRSEGQHRADPVRAAVPDPVEMRM